MKHCGMDVAQRSSAICVVTPRGRVEQEREVRTTPEGLQSFFVGKATMQVYLEAGGQSDWVARQLEGMGHEPVVIDPGQARAIGWSKLKNDRVDARLLADLGRAGLLVRVHRRREESEALRRLLVTRAGLVRVRAGLCRQVRAMLRRAGLVLPRVAAEGLVQYMRTHGSCPVHLTPVIEPLLEVIDEVSRQVDHLERRLQGTAEDPTVRRLVAIPGVGLIVALTYCAVLDTAARFPDGRRVASYLGLVPSENTSGGKRRLGGITKRGNREVRWLLVQAAHALLRSKQDTALKRWGAALAARKGKRKAAVAVARKLAVVMWALWKTEVDYVPFHGTTRRRRGVGPGAAGVVRRKPCATAAAGSSKTVKRVRRGRSAGRV